MPNNTASLISAPIQDPVVDESGRARKTWVFFFNQLSDGDSGTEWTPVATNLAGSYTLKGKYFKNSGFIDFWITVDPNTSSSSTIGTTFVDLPFDVTVASPCFAVYGATAVTGLIDPSTNRALFPSWSGVSSIVTVTGRVFTK